MVLYLFKLGKVVRLGNVRNKLGPTRLHFFENHFAWNADHIFMTLMFMWSLYCIRVHLVPWSWDQFLRRGQVVIVFKRKTITTLKNIGFFVKLGVNFFITIYYCQNIGYCVNLKKRSSSFCAYFASSQRRHALQVNILNHLCWLRGPLNKYFRWKFNIHIFEITTTSLYNT